MCNIEICICKFYQVLICGLLVSIDELPARYICCVLLVCTELMGMQVRIAVVGQGTGQIIEAHQEPLLHIEYIPPKVRLVCWSSA